MNRARLSLFGIAACIGCAQNDLPPLGQIVLTVDTDAVVPPRPGAPNADTRARALFDRLRIEFLRRQDGQTVVLQTHEVSIHAGLFAERKVSVGIVPPPGESEFLVRARLFRNDRVVGDQPAPSSTLDTTATLPRVAAEGKIEASILLRTDDVGTRIGETNPIAVTLGPPTASLVGTWPGGERALCGDALQSEEACVPGGAYWFGDPALRGRTRENDFVEERLVVVSPYFLDKTEVTVASFRSAWPKLKAQGVPAPRFWTGRRGEGEAADESWCTFSEAELSPTVSALPINCIPWDTARAYCTALGKDLPSEAQYEYVMSGLGDESSYPWGDDEPSCTDAVWGRGGVGPGEDDDGTCRAPGTFGWMDFPGTGLRDRIGAAILRNGTNDEIVDLGGNVTEWTLDPWTLPGQGYWAATSPRIDPLPDAPAAGSEGLHPARGTSWLGSSATARAGHRLPFIATVPYLPGGFRCARRAARKGGG